MSRFTYLIGAGASAQRIPTVKEFVDGIEYALSLFQKEHPKATEYIDLGSTDYNSLIAKHLRWLLRETKSHATIDTFARKLFLTQGEDGVDYIRLKHLLRFLFIVWHLKKEVKIFNQPGATFYFDVDPRYDALFANIIDYDGKDSRIDDRISIISWNYDYQIEYSLSKFFDGKKASIMTQLPPEIETPAINTNLFSKIALNGCIFPSIDSKFCEEIKKSHEENDLAYQSATIKMYFEEYQKSFTNKESSICYSWEQKPEVLQNRKRAREILAKTDYLTIIGYSFPNFNKSVDKEIFNTIKSNVKVRLQCHPDDFQEIKERFWARIPEADNSGRFEHITKYTRQVLYTDREFFIHSDI